MESIAVITPTRKRPHLLRRAIASVAAQVCSVPVRHHAVVDDCDQTRVFLDAERDLPENFSWVFSPRSPTETSGFRRLAMLRNHAVRSLTGVDWISFLDEDNEFEQDHLESLLGCARRTGRRAVHSWLRMFYSDGHPFAEERDPWSRDPEKARAKYLEMVARGIRSPASNIFRDRADPLCTDGAVQSVDTGEWLLARSLLLQMPIPEEFTDQDWEEMRSEDDKFMAQLIASGEPVACTGQATLRYYLGGCSNTFRLL